MDMLSKNVISLVFIFLNSFIKLIRLGYLLQRREIDNNKPAKKLWVLVLNDFWYDMTFNLITKSVHFVILSIFNSLVKLCYPFLNINKSDWNQNYFTRKADWNFISNESFQRSLELLFVTIFCEEYDKILY